MSLDEHRSRAGKLRALLAAELRQLTTIQASDRAWQMPFAAALAMGLPLLIGAWYDHLTFGLVAAVGGLVFLYLPSTPLHHRMVTLMTCAFGMNACYTLGLLCHLQPALTVPVLAFVAILTTMVCRFFAIGPPGSLFFIMVAAIGAYSPVTLSQVPLMVGLLSMGSLLACLVGFVYSLYMLRRHAPRPIAPLPPPTFDALLFDPIVIGAFVALSLLVVQALDLQKGYWVPVSCLAVMQNASLRAVWNKQLQRVIGTNVGLLISWFLLLLPLDKWGVCAAVMALTFIIELSVVRHYAFAVAFITPLAIVLAEAATLGHVQVGPLIQARFLDTVLGCLIGFAGGFCLHSPRFRSALGVPLRRLMPARLR
jgi:uncharacterized membrane protein YccC